MFHRIGASAFHAGLSNTLELCRIMGNPEKQFRSVHIAGTNGKGSTSHFLASILQEAGYQTGLFTSPHLRDFRERIRVNGKMIPKSQVTQFVNKFHDRFEPIQPSFYEWSFALASRYFDSQKVDVAIMETGMGGRLDSTNVLNPILSVITNIGLDHQQFLGDTIEKIAAEKAGIIKKGIPVIIGETQHSSSEVFRSYARHLNAPIYFADQHYSIQSSGYTRHKIPLLWFKLLAEGVAANEIYYSPLTAAYQCKNLLTVIQAIELLKQQGFRISKGHIRNGIRRVIRHTGLQGRWQVLSQSPLTIADIGHNKDGISEVVKQLERTPYDQLHFVIGIVNDKDVHSMLELLPRQATYYFCKADIPRGMDAEELGRIAMGIGLKGDCYPSVKSAYQKAQNAANPNDLIFVGGSNFIVAEII